MTYALGGMGEEEGGRGARVRMYTAIQIARMVNRWADYRHGQAAWPGQSSATRSDSKGALGVLVLGPRCAQNQLEQGVGPKTPFSV